MSLPSSNIKPEACIKSITDQLPSEIVYEKENAITDTLPSEIVYDKENDNK